MLKADAQRAPRSVLVLEDQPLILFMLEAMLRDFGCANVLSATSLADLPSILPAGLEAAILDVNLSEGTSLAYASALADRGLPIIFVSGSRRSELPDRLKVVPFVTKPIDPNELRAALIAVSTRAEPASANRPRAAEAA